MFFFVDLTIVVDDSTIDRSITEISRWQLPLPCSREPQEGVQVFYQLYFRHINLAHQSIFVSIFPVFK